MNEWIPLSGFRQDILSLNLSALRGTQPGLAEWMQRQVARSDLLIRPLGNGFFACTQRMERKEILIHDPRTIEQDTTRGVQRILQIFQQGAWLVLAGGLGFGYVLREAAMQLEIQHRGEPKGILWMEPDPGILYAAFRVIDFSALIRTGRILWAVGADLEQQLSSLCRQHHFETLNASQISLLKGCSLSSLPGESAQSILQKSLRTFWFEHQRLRENYFQILHRAEDHWNQTNRPLNRVWTHLNTDRGGAEMLVGLIEGFRALGLQAQAPVIRDRLFTRFFRVAADFFAFRPDLMLCQNHSSNYMASFAETVPIPRVVWYVDNPANMADIPFHSQDRIFSISPHFAKEIEQRGKKMEAVLHAAAPMEMVPPCEQGAWLHAVSYVGAVHDHRRILERIPSMIRDILEQSVQTFIQNPNFVESPCSAVRQLDFAQIDVLHRILVQEIPKGCLMTPSRLIEYFIYQEANSRRRVEALSSLEEMEGLGIYGPKDWLDLLPSDQLRKAYRGPIQSRADLLNLYRNSRINLSINSLQGFGFANPRVFDVPAAGGFLLAEWVPVLPDLLEENTEVVSFRTFEEMKKQAYRYREDHALRVKIILCAQKRMQEEHSYKHRAMTILKTLESSSSE